MQQLRHKRFSTLPTGRQVQSEQLSMPICYCYAPANTVIGAAGNWNDSDKQRPWYKR